MLERLIAIGMIGRFRMMAQLGEDGILGQRGGILGWKDISVLM